jgi:hypothetical protein
MSILFTLILTTVAVSFYSILNHFALNCLLLHNYLNCTSTQSQAKVLGSLLIGGTFLSVDGSFCFPTACSLAIKLGCVLGCVFDECELLFFRWEIIARSRLMYARKL